jgi:PAT family beta-lactamase induction signal transducer AmpG
LQDIRNHPWIEALRVYTRPQVLAMIFLGFSAGLPFLLVFSTLTAWLTDAGVSRSVIGFFGWVGITYSIKFFWAPIIDRLPLPLLTGLLGRRRSWMLVAQVGIAAGLIGMSLLDPATQTTTLALLALLVAFSSATQDIVIDAWRIESVQSTYQGAMATAYVGGYRVALLVAGAGAFYLADFYDWHISYQVMGLLMGVGILTTLIIRDPQTEISQATRDLEARLEEELHITNLQGQWQRFARWFTEAIVAPFVDFFERNGKHALLILALIAVYKLSDITMGVMANPFYLDLGFSKPEIANITKIFGFGMTITGAALGGLLVVRFGLFRPLLAGAILVASTNLLFAYMAVTEPSTLILAAVISADYLSGGLATAAFIAWLSSLTNTAYTATQYALFSSLMTLLAKFISGFAGVVVDGYGYFLFFLYAGILGIPAIVLTVWLLRHPSQAAEETINKTSN